MRGHSRISDILIEWYRGVLVRQRRPRPLILSQPSSENHRSAAWAAGSFADIGHRNLKALEPLLQLSGSPLVFNATAPGDLTVRVQGVESDALVQVVDASGNVVSSRPLASTTEMRVYGSDGDDRLTIGAGGINALPISFAGGAGNDTLTGPQVDLTWNLTGVNAGTVGRASFAQVENPPGRRGIATSSSSRLARACPAWSRAATRGSRPSC